MGGEGGGRKRAAWRQFSLLRVLAGERERERERAVLVRVLPSKCRRRGRGVVVVVPSRAGPAAARRGSSRGRARGPRPVPLRRGRGARGRENADAAGPAEVLADAADPRGVGVEGGGRRRPSRRDAGGGGARGRCGCHRRRPSVGRPSSRRAFALSCRKEEVRFLGVG